MLQFLFYSFFAVVIFVCIMISNSYEFERMKRVHKILTCASYTTHVVCTRCGMRTVYDIFNKQHECANCGYSELTLISERFVSTRVWYKFWKTSGYYINKDQKVTGYYNEHLEYKKRIDKNIGALIDYKLEKLHKHYE